MQPCCRPRKLEPGTRPLRPSSASRSSFGGRAIRLGLRVAGHHVVDVLPFLFFSDVVSSTGSISQLANDDERLGSLGRSHASPQTTDLLGPSRLFQSWHPADAIDGGLPLFVRLFPPSYVSGKPRGKMFQLKETCPRFSRESRFTQGHFMCLFKTRKSPVLPFQSRLSPGSGRSQFHGPHGSARPKVSGYQPASWWRAQDPPRQQARHDRRSDLFHSEAPPRNDRCQITPPGPSAVGGGLNFRLASQTRA